jgi:hypothetical protein
MKKLLLLSLSVLCAACVREIAHDGKPDSTDISLANFNFATTQSVTFQINTLDNHDVPLRNVPREIAFNILAPNFCNHHPMQRSTVLIVWTFWWISLCPTKPRPSC